MHIAQLNPLKQAFLFRALPALDTNQFSEILSYIGKNFLSYGKNFRILCQFPRSFLQKMLGYDEKSLSYAEFWP